MVFAGSARSPPHGPGSSSCPGHSSSRCPSRWCSTTCPREPPQPAPSAPNVSPRRTTCRSRARRSGSAGPALLQEPRRLPHPALLPGPLRTRQRRCVLAAMPMCSQLCGCLAACLSGVWVRSRCMATVLQPDCTSGTVLASLAGHTCTGMSWRNLGK